MPKVPRKVTTIETRVFVGVDPGAKGGIAAIYQQVPSGRWQCDVWRMPDTERDIWDLFDAFNDRETIVLIEKLHSRPGQGAQGMWKFSGNYHGLRMAIIGHHLTMDPVIPMKWQQAMGITPKGKNEKSTTFKNRIKARAQELFPMIRGITLHVSDALVMAEYCRRKHTGTL